MAEIEKEREREREREREKKKEEETMREARSRNVLTGTTSKLNHEAEVGARVRGDASRNLSNSSIKEGTIASRRILPSDEKRRKGLAPAL